MNKLFRTVSVQEENEQPKESGYYLFSDDGMLCRAFYDAEQGVWNPTPERISGYIKEVELPTEEEINNETDFSDKWDMGYASGCKHILSLLTSNK